MQKSGFCSAVSCPVRVDEELYVRHNSRRSMALQDVYITFDDGRGDGWDPPFKFLDEFGGSRSGERNHLL